MDLTLKQKKNVISKKLNVSSIILLTFFWFCWPSFLIFLNLPSLEFCQLFNHARRIFYFIFFGSKDIRGIARALMCNDPGNFFDIAIIFLLSQFNSINFPSCIHIMMMISRIFRQAFWIEIDLILSSYDNKKLLFCVTMCSLPFKAFYALY